jgi:diguanylate cyclase (GGDEF)-like protein
VGSLSWLQPRDADLAARVLSTLALVAGGVTVCVAAIAPSEQGATPTSVALVAIAAASVVVVALLLRRMRNRGQWMWALFPFAAIGVIVLLDLLTSDASVSAQVFFLFPALYAGFSLRRTGALFVCAAAVAGDLVDVFAELPARVALVQGSYLVAAIVATTSVLIASGERQDALVAELRRQAAVDPLTGLVTRRVFDEAATSALSGAVRAQGVGLILLDIDHFKQVNDEHGHPVGDAVLVEISQLLLESTRESDTISRLGGDEIAIVLAGCSLSTLNRRAEEIVTTVRAHSFVIDGIAPFRLSVSVGIAHLPTHGSNLRALYGAADASLYVAKRAGRDQVGPLPDTFLPSQSAAA